MRKDGQERRGAAAAERLAWLTASFGLLMTLVWHGRSEWLWIHFPRLFDMRHITALAFLVSGAGALAALHGRAGFARAAGAALLTAGGISFAQYAMGVNLGIDQFLLEDYFHPEHPYPGRMAPNTALAFMLAGAVLLLAADGGAWRLSRTLAAEFLSFLVFAFGMTAAAGYVREVQFAYSWGSHTSMAAHTAGGFMLLGAALTALCWRRQNAPVARVPLWAPALLCFLVLIFDVSTPFEVAAGIAYIPLVFCSLWFARPHMAFVFAAIATVLATLGYFATHADRWLTLPGIVNRPLTIGALWFVAVLVYLKRRDEEALRRSGERYRALAAASAQVIWTWEPGEKGELDAVKRWWEDVTGQPGETILNFGWLESVHSEDRERARRIWAEASAEGRDFEMEYRVRARRGGWRHVSVRGIVLRNLDGAVREFVGALNDITEQREAEAGLLRYTRELERSNQELDDFAYIASHDLKEPLRGLFNHASFLLEDYRGKLDEDGQRRLHRLSHLSQRMETLVNDLLYFSRLGRADLAVRETDLNETVAGIAQMMESFLKERNARIEIPRPLPRIVCDGTRVAEAFRNLITNAVKYNDKPERRVEVGFLDRADMPEGPRYGVFYVRDNGIGIAPEFHQEIFRIFKRLQSLAGEKESGTGAGLTFVKKIVERHGGRVWLESEPGRGTVFYFTLNQGGNGHEQPSTFAVAEHPAR